ncbi:MAG TPA: SHOCT domain-containing protein [Chloroflexota bacterium]|nr:SHOCT domain-containing protein [Chloroflexota bacterium]
MRPDHRWLLIVLGVLIVLVLIGPMMAGTMMGPGIMMGPGMMWSPGPQGAPSGVTGWSWGMGMAFGWLAMLAFWGTLIVGVILLMRSLMGGAARPGSPTSESALDILKRRYAEGEIDQATYERMRRELE